MTVKQSGIILWNGVKISADQLAEYSSLVREMEPIPFTILQIDDGAECSVVRRVRYTIDERAKCRTPDLPSVCGEGPDPWARVGDVLLPNGQKNVFYLNKSDASGGR